MLPPLLQGSLHDDGAFVVMEAVADRVEAVLVVPRVLRAGERAAGPARLRAAVPNLDALIRAGQIEFTDHRNSYLRTATGELDAEGVLAAWSEREQSALSRGYADSYAADGVLGHRHGDVEYDSVH